MALQQNLDLKSIYDAISVERNYGSAQDLTYHEYVASAMFGRVVVTENRLTCMFSYIDTNNDGRFDARDLQIAMGGDVPIADVQVMIRHADGDGDGVVTKK